MSKPAIIITGKNGQLGSQLQHAVTAVPQFNFIFFAKDELDICNELELETLFKKYQPVFFINTAAYTAVDKAEADQENAYLVNAAATGIIAKACSRCNTTLIHISTDYVFNGKGSEPYNEDATTDPVNYYGYTKWKGEQLALNNNPQTIVIRTSWVYSVYGNNFVKTMLRLMKDRKDINVVSDQFGSPTFAKDLAGAIIQIVVASFLSAPSSHYGIYHFSNEGAISWCDFATAIRDIKQLDCLVHPITTAEFPTPAKRPAYSVMSKEKIHSTFNIQLHNWRDSLEECLKGL